MLDTVDSKEGLWLENRPCHLKWRMARKELISSTRPDFEVRKGRHTKFAWNDQVWGMRCQIVTEFGKHHPSVLSWVRITFFTPARHESLEEDFCWLRDKLIAKFGQPVVTRGDQMEYGEADWDLGGVVVRQQYFDAMDGGHWVYVFIPGQE